MTYRAAATSIANWAAEQGGIPLFTIEGRMRHHSSDASFHVVPDQCFQINGTTPEADRLACLAGEEPDSPTASWNLPPLSKHASTANVQSAESLSDDRARTISEGWKQYVALSPGPRNKPQTAFSRCQS